ncbi:MAG: hypothetical protein H0T76_17415 [Nannocystis sp.]|nr:hypothetical protein [Nannocystis sp.]MBA3548264.1 hypothetical protein [Nannocystis sp.]
MNDENIKSSGSETQPKPNKFGGDEQVEVLVGRPRRARVEIKVPPGIGVMVAGNELGTKIVLLGFMSDEGR